MWGELPEHQAVTINGHAFEITENAFLFLTTLREHQSRRIEQGLEGLPQSYPGHVPKALGATNWSGHLEWIWMDSICINQSDPNERNHQVQMMQKIYGLADHVFFHIGKETTEVEKAFDLRYITIDGQLWKSWENGGLPKGVMRGLVHEFNKSRYSLRLWIIQELVLGRQVSLVTSELIIPLPELEQGDSDRYGELHNVSGTTQGFLRSILNARLRWHATAPVVGQRRGSRLVDLLQDYQRHQCQDIRDRVYGLLGICSEDIPIDYNLTSEELFISIMAYAIAREPKQTNALPRIDAFRKSLGAALRFPLEEDYYGALHDQLLKDHNRSGSGYICERWWYCGEGSGGSLQEKLKYKPVFWDTGYDSTAEAPDVDEGYEVDSD
jgi:hypothetical protein